MLPRAGVLACLCALMLVGCGSSSPSPESNDPSGTEETQGKALPSKERSSDDVPGYSVSHRDVYDEARIVCSLSSPREIARDFNMNTSDPDRIAKRYARGYAAPLRQDAYVGCLEGMLGG